MWVTWGMGKLARMGFPPCLVLSPQSGPGSRRINIAQNAGPPPLHGCVSISVNMPFNVKQRTSCII